MKPENFFCKNRKAIFIGTASILISGFGAFTIYHQLVLQDNLSNLQNNLSKIQKNIDTLQSGLSNVNDNLSAVENTANATKDSLDTAGIQEKLEKLTSKVDDTITALNKNSDVTKSNLEKMHILSDDYSNLLTRMQNEVSCLNQQGKHAEIAWKKSQDALNTQETEIALLYAVNAVSTDPTRIEYYQNLAKISEQLADEDSSRLEEILRIMDMGFYRIEAAQLQALTEEANKLRGRIDKIIQTRISHESTKQEEKEQQIAQELQQMWNKLETPGDYKEQIPSCQQMLAELQKSPDSVDYRKCASILSFLISAQTIDSTLGDIERSLSAPEPVSDETLQFIKSRLQTVSSAILSLGAIDFSSLPPSYLSCMAHFGKRLDESNQKAADTQSLKLARIFNEIHEHGTSENLTDDWREEFNAIDNTIPIEGGVHTCAIQREKRIITKLNTIASAMSSRKEQRRAREEIAKYSDRLEDIEKRRIAEYQKWAVNVCKNAIAHYEKCSVFEDADANYIIYRTEFIKINVALLTPESMEIYQYIRSKIIEEYDKGIIAAQVMQLIATCDKKQLKDF